MRKRRQPPSLVSMWMLDVFCCALGCVTLLWLLNTRLAADERTRASAALADLNSTQQSLTNALTAAATKQAAFENEITNLKNQVARIDNERRILNARVANLNSEIESKKNELTTAANRNAEIADELQKKTASAEELKKKLATATTLHDDSAKLLRMQEAEAKELTAKLQAAEDAMKKLSARAGEMSKAQDELATAKTAARDLQKKLDESNANIVDLQGEKKKLADRFDKLRIESDARFAGIAMTGRRVVFLLDRSGSMNLLSETVEAPRKWETVVETLVKVMRSLPEMEKYQIVVFSAEAKFFVDSNDWQSYEGEPTLQAVRSKLLAVKPEGDTNLFDAFNLAFKLKPDGLDTIYLFSDGLPTTGPSYTRDTERSLPGPKRIEFLINQMKTAMTTRWNPPDGRRVRINSIGFFYESPEVGAFLWALSRDNDGSFVGMSRP